jgi:8-oxo-dGTP diphosphatase
MVSADVVLFKKNGNQVSILLIKRLNPPYKDCWALPGGFLEEDESLLDCANRELKEETNISGIELEQLHAFGDPGRDPRGHCVTIVYLGWVHNLTNQPIAGDDAKEVQWFPLAELPVLAFDHKKVIEMAEKKIGSHP